jgi:hypothetical protein
VQLLYFDHRFRAITCSHICGDLGCLACEFHFLFDMLSQALTMPPNV